MTSRATTPVVLLLAAALAAGCGGDGSGSGGAGSGSDGARGNGGDASIETPEPLEAGGEFVVCTDVPYPPAEFLEGDKFVGYEIDVMNEVATRLGTEAVYEKTLFDAIIPSLQAKKCDAIMSSMNVTPEREEQVDFVEYMEIGQSLMVQSGEGDGIEELDDLAGRSVAVQVGTTLKDALDERSKELEANGAEGIDVQTYPDGGAAASALKADKVDVFFADSPVVAEYVNKDPDSFEFAGEPIDPLPVGIAIRKDDDELHEAVQEAMDAMYEDGTMVELLEKWNVEDFALETDGGGTTEEGGDAEG